MTTPKLTQDLERLRALVEKQTVPCPLAYTHRFMLGMPEGGGDTRGAICADCHGTNSVPDPAWAGVLNVLRQECPCAVGNPSQSYLPYEDFPVTCKRCYIRGRHTDECICGGNNYVLRHQWQELADAGMPFAVDRTLDEVMLRATFELQSDILRLYGYGYEKAFNSGNYDGAATQALTEMLEKKDG